MNGHAELDSELQRTALDHLDGLTEWRHREAVAAASSMQRPEDDGERRER
jgi:hypothetical protein